MSNERLRRLLNDYLDDRLEATARERFEERLATDESLARQLALAMEVRAELRDGDEELSEAFYTRTVAHFSGGKRRLPFGLSWSTAGLAVATITAAAIFIPAILQKELPGMPGGTTPVAPEKKARAIGATDSEGAADEELSEPLPEQQGLESSEPLRAAPPPPAPSAEETAPERRVVVTSPSTRAQPVELDESTSRLQAEREVEESRNLAPGRGGAAKSADRLEMNAKLEDAFAGFRGALPTAVELPIDLAGAGEVRVLDARDPALRAAVESMEQRQRGVESRLDAPAEATAAVRFVAIGPRAGLDACSALRVRRTESAWEIRFDESGSRVGSVSCGIEIPGDGAAILFQGWPVDE